MTIFDAILLGIVQGVAEFLPISSSGHLVLVQSLLGIKLDGVLFDTVLHMATLAAIIVFFFKDIIHIKINEVIAIVIGTIPAVLVGLFFKDQIEFLFTSTLLVSLALMLTGGINIYTDKKLAKADDFTDQAKINWKSGLIVGLFQAFAIIPGISRSGSTVACGVSQGLSREHAFRFSFLLGIPAIAGAGVLQLKDLLEVPILNIDLIPLVAGAIIAFISGLLSLIIFKYIMVKARMEIFGYYCLILGLLSIFIHLI